MEDAIAYRSATERDVDALAMALLEASNWNGENRKTLADMYSSHYVNGWPKRGDSGVVASTPNGDVIGAAWFRFFEPDDAGYGYVAADVPELSIGVSAEFRGKGVGTRLLEDLIAQARALGLTAVSLSVEDGNRARHLYERFGFVKVGRNGGSDTLLLSLDSSE